MTIAEMRVVLGLAETVPDEEVAERYRVFAFEQADPAPLVSLADVRLQLHLDGDDTEEDELLELYAAAAIQACAARINRPIAGDAASLTLDQLATLKVAVLMLVGHWHRNRESVTPGQAIELPMGVSWMLEPLRSYAWPD